MRAMRGLKRTYSKPIQIKVNPQAVSIEHAVSTEQEYGMGMTKSQSKDILGQLKHIS